MADKEWQLTESEWKKRLTPEQYYVMRQKGTEHAFGGCYWNEKTPGVFVCAACGLPLFKSKTKYESGTGWPSFWEPISSDAVVFEEDRAHGMIRTEVKCSRCDSHLGHVFDDGPQPSGKRYCLNSVSLRLIPD